MKSEKGYTLIAVVIALGLLGIIAAAFLGGLATASRTLIHADERETANDLAESQMESLKNQPYDANLENDPPVYTVISAPPGYGIDVTAERLDQDDPPDPSDDDGIQKIKVTVSHQYLSSWREVVVLEDYKVAR